VWPARAEDGRFVPMYSHFVSTGSADTTLEGIRRNYAETDRRVQPQGTNNKRARTRS